MPDEREPTEAELEERLRQLLGEAESADSDELDAIELKLKGIEEQFQEQKAKREEQDTFFDAEFDQKLKQLHEKADKAKARQQGKAVEANRTMGIDSTASRGLGFGLVIAYSMVGPLIAGWLIGLLIDRSSGTGNSGQTWGTVIGMFCGFVAAIFLVTRTSGKQ
jgi:F0F1-type ATP synthase assembly protein I